MIKPMLLACFAAAFVLAAAAFDAASAARAAMEFNEAAQATNAPRVTARLLARAERALNARWSAPRLWHAGALEALSWNAALRATAGEAPAPLQESAAALERGLALAPIQPNGWFRLAAIRQTGVAGDLCDARVCLEHSFKAAAAVDPELACARLGLAHALGEPLRADDPRVRAFIDTVADRETLARCLSFLPAEDLFAVLIASPRQ